MVLQMSHPYLTDAGDLRIPCDAPDRFRWWAAGQHPAQTARELGMPEHLVAARYLPPQTKSGIRRLNQEQ